MKYSQFCDDQICCTMVDSTKEDTARYRSPCFSQAEVLLLIKLVDKYKNCVLTKCNKALANHAKDVAWVKIAREFNISQLGPMRSVDSLKGKWENLKRLSRKTSKNLLDSENCELDDINSRVIALMTAAESVCSNDTFPDILDEEMEQNIIDENGLDLMRYADSDAPKDVESDVDEDGDKNARFRSQNFSPQESKLLLQCVRKEKKHVFSRDITSRAIEIKNQAWSRIADSYNKLSPQKRSAKSLRMKFTSMKKMARKIGAKDMFLKNIGKQNKHEDLVSKDNFKNIKKEPFFEEKIDNESDHYSDREGSHFNELDEEDKIEAPPDPLSCVLNGDSGLGSSSSQFANWSLNQPDKEIVKLQKELLNYQMETAKLERKRVEDALLEDAKERESRAIERALHLRAARLSALYAATRLRSRRVAATRYAVAPRSRNKRPGIQTP